MTQTIIANINSANSWVSFLVALFFIEACLLISFRILPGASFWGATINEWYDQFGLVAILLDITIVLIGFWLTMWFYQLVWGSKDIVFWKFLALFLVIQIIHDIGFYFLIINPVPKGHNAIIDLMKRYGERHGGLTVLGDSLMVILAVVIWWCISGGFNWFEGVAFGGLIGVLLVSLYMIGYGLFTKW
jgi:hypothetical protein